MQNENTQQRTPAQIARLALKDAKAEGLISRFEVRGSGRATIYPAFGDYGKFYTTGVLDTLTVLDQLRTDRKSLRVGAIAEQLASYWRGISDDAREPQWDTSWWMDVAKVAARAYEDV